MDVETTALPGVLLIKPKVFGDARGFFMESWNADRYQRLGLPRSFAQDNLSRSSGGVLRGLHFQQPGGQGKLVGVLEGEVFDVAVDIRRGSPTFGRWVGYLLNGENRWQLYVPPGFAHGFYVTSRSALFQYKCTTPYQPQHEHSLRWDDPAVGIVWPAGPRQLSDKDAAARRLDQLHTVLPAYQGEDARSERHEAGDRRILLVGASGQVGSALLEPLRQLGTVVATTRPGATPPSDRAHRAATVALDLNDAGAIRDVVRRVSPDLIVNAAAYTAVDRAESEPAIAAAINATAPAVLAEQAERCGAAMVHFCTDYVYDGRGGRPWREGDVPDPQSVYGKTKLAGTQAVLQTAAAAIVLRVSWVYDHCGQNFLNTMLRLGAERDALRVVDDQHGAPTSARQIASAVVQMLQQLPSGDYRSALSRHGGLYHFAAAGETTWCRYAQRALALAAGRGLPIRCQRIQPIGTADYPTPAARPANSRLDSSKLRDTFGVYGGCWQQELESTVERIAAHLHQQPIRRAA